MNRRHFFRNTTLATLGSGLVISEPISRLRTIFDKNKKAKNIIFIVSDGMSSGTLNMGDLFIKRTQGRGSHWLNLYRENKVTRALMDMAPANSMVTDSAAASSSWGGGVRVKNGSINIDPNGERVLPIWQKFKKVGKKAGCVTTVPITHATPAGFMTNSKSRNDQAGIAEDYLKHNFDVLMGGGDQYFNPQKRKDGKDIYGAFEEKGYQVFQNKKSLDNLEADKPILGVFSDSALPYTVDYLNDQLLQESTPTLAELTTIAINHMSSHPEGFVLQVEGGKVDWAAHANDAAGLIYDQVALDDCIKVAMEFAESNGETLVILATDHGNANPGLIYGKEADNNFDTLMKYKASNDVILNSIMANDSYHQVIEKFEQFSNIVLSQDEAQQVLNYYKGLEKPESGLYNYKNLPYELVSNFQKKRTSIGWIGNEHSADYVEIAMYGAGSHLLKPFIKNTDLHLLMLNAAEVENNF